MKSHGTELIFHNTANLYETINTFSELYSVDFGSELLYYRELFLQCIDPLLTIAAAGAYKVNCEYMDDVKTCEESYKFKNAQSKNEECLLILAHGMEFNKDGDQRSVSFEVVEKYLHEAFDIIALYRTENNTEALQVSVLQLLHCEMIEKCYDAYLMETMAIGNRTVLLLIPRSPELLAIRLDLYSHLPLTAIDNGSLNVIH